MKRERGIAVKLTVLAALTICLLSIFSPIVAAPEEAGCNHVHDAACGFEETGTCNHVHDETCGGLVEAVGIKGFEALDGEVLNQSYTVGNITLEGLKLPETLVAKREADNDLTIEGVRWEHQPTDAAPNFDPETAGAYLFAPILPEGYVLADGVELPRITVELTAAAQVPQVLAGAGPQAVAGDFVVTKTEDGGDPAATDYSFDAGLGVLFIDSDTPMTISMKNPGDTTTHRIVVRNGKNAKITLDGVHILSGSAGIDTDCGKGNTTITLKAEAKNIIKGGFYRPGIRVSTGNSLVIDGKGELEVTGGNYCAGIGGNVGGSGITHAGEITINNGTINVQGGDYSAGIGGGAFEPGGTGGSASTININGGIVNAKGGAHGGSGIGGGGGLKGGAGGTININGGTVTATGTTTARDIGPGGGGGLGSPAEINITGGSVNPTRGGISNQPKNAANTTVHLVTLTLENLDKVAAISNSSFAGYGLKDVKTDKDGKLYFWLPQKDYPGSNVVAEGNRYLGDVSVDSNNSNSATLEEDQELKITREYGSGGFSRDPLTDGIIINEAGDYTISMVPGVVEAKRETVRIASGVAANLTLNNVQISNTGYQVCALDASKAGDTTIKIPVNTTSNLTSGGERPGIYAPHENTMTITGGGKLKAKSGDYAAGIGSAPGSHFRKIVIDGCEVDASATVDGAGIGSGSSINAASPAYFNIDIKNAKVRAEGGANSAGIGGGTTIGAGVIEITNSEVEAIGGSQGAGIGGGFAGSAGDITINSGMIVATGGKGAQDIGTGASLGVDTGKITIVGGSIKAPNIKPQPQDKTPRLAEKVYLVTLTLHDEAGKPVANLPLSSSSFLTSDGYANYGLEGVRTDEHGKLYFWLPPEKETDKSAFSNGDKYTGKVTVLNENANEAILSYYPRELNVVYNGNGDGYTLDDDGTITLTEDGHYTISMIKPGTTATREHIKVADGKNNTVRLDGVNIDLKNIMAASAFDAGLSGETTVVLGDGKSTLQSGSGYAGLQVPSGKKLIITGSGELDATGANSGAGIGGGYYAGCGTILIDSGIVNATGGSSVRGEGGSGIGGAYGESSKDGGFITVNGGVVTAKGGHYSAGIGGSAGGNGGEIIINGGMVTATSFSQGAGIGGGSTGAGGKIAINGGTVVATAGENADDIGSGHNYYGPDGTVTITGGSINPTRGLVNGQPTNGANAVFLETLTLANGQNSTAADVPVTSSDFKTLNDKDYGLKDVKTDANGKLYFWLSPVNTALHTATAGDKTYSGQIEVKSGNKSNHTLYYGKELKIEQTNGIGGYTRDKDGRIIIDKGGEYTISMMAEVKEAKTETVTVTASDDTKVTLNGVNINVSGTYQACAFDAGNSGKTTVVLGDGKSILKSGSNRAGLEVRKDKSLTITGSGELEATGGSYSAGIGGGDYGTGGEVTINGGTVTAIGSNYAAGIGGGLNGDGGTININDGTVNANGGVNAAGIGGGYGDGWAGGSGGNINISGGTVIANGGSGGSGIGGGGGHVIGGAGRDIAISGGTVTATGNRVANDIGPGSGHMGLVADATITITGGSVNATHQNIKPQPTNSVSPVHLNTLTLEDTPKNAAITSGSIGGVECVDTPNAADGKYGIKDVKTDENGVVYFYLPISGSQLVSLKAKPVSTQPERYYNADYEREAGEIEQTLWYQTQPPVVEGPEDIVCNLNEGGKSLTVTAHSVDGGVLSYQWYRNSTNSNTGGTIIAGATGPSYAVPTNAAGTIYYYCEVTNTNGALEGDPVMVVSQTGKVVVRKATPTITFSATTAGHDAILKATLTGPQGAVAPTGQVTFYDGTQMLGEGTIDGDTATYSWKNIATGVHSLRAVYSGDNNYQTIEGTTTYDKSKQDQAALVITPPQDPVVYGGESFTLGTTGGSGNGVVTWSVIDSSNAIGINPDTGEVTIKNAGTAMVQARKAGDKDFNETKAELLITVERAAPQLRIACDSISYGDKPVPRLIENTSGAAVRYDYKVRGADDETYTETVPSAAGDYTVRARVAQTDNYLEAAATADFSIAQATPGIDLTITKADAASATLRVVVTGKGGDLPSGAVAFLADGVSLGEIPLSGGEASLTWDNIAVGDHEVEVKYLGDGNYKAAQTTEKYNKDKEDQAPLTITGLPDTITYGDKGFTLGTSGGTGSGAVTWSLSQDKEVIEIGEGSGAVTIKNAGTASITATKDGGSQYNDISVTKSITVQKADLQLTLKCADINFGEAPAPKLSGNAGEGNVTYSYKRQGTDDSTYSQTPPTAAGDYTVRAGVDQTANYNGGETTADFSIKKVKASLTLTLEPATEVAYGDTITLKAELRPGGLSFLTRSAPLPVNGEITLTEGGVEVGKLSLQDGVGQYLYTLSRTGEHSFVASFAGNDSVGAATSKAATCTAGKARQNLTITGVPETITYGDEGFTIAVTGGLDTTVSYKAMPEGQDIISVDPATGAVTIHKAGKAAIVVTKPGDDNYQDAEETVDITVGQATPQIQGDLVASDANVGKPLAEVSLPDLVATDLSGNPLPGKLEWKDPAALVHGAGEYIAVFTPDDTNYAPQTLTINVSLSTTPPTITRLEATVQGATAAKLNVAGSAKSALSYQWQVKGADWEDIPGATRADFDYQGLTPNTSYTVRVILTDANGNVTISEEITFTTAAADPTPAPSTSVKSNGTPTGDGSHPYLWAILILAAGVGLIGVHAYKRQ